MLIPKRHFEYIFDLDEEQYSQLHVTARRLSEPIRRATGSKRIKVAIEGFGVPHVHIHLVPVDRGNELDPKRAVRATLEELSSMVE